MTHQKTAIIIPCYNEALRLPVDKFIAFANANTGIDLWFVNDGSTDETLLLLNDLKAAHPAKLFVLNLEKNGGKAEAVRQGILFLGSKMIYDYLGFLDSDLSAPLSELINLHKIITEKPLLLVAGARVRMIGRNIQRSPFRHYFGRVFATYQDTLLKLGNYDTQCGLKIFQSKFALQLFAEAFTSSWFFDIELFLRAKIILGQKAYYTEVAEQPLEEWKEVKGSKLKMTDFLKAPFEILKIYRRYQQKSTA